MNALFSLALTLFASTSAFAQIQKYSPYQTAEYTCSTQDWVGNEESFILKFTDLDYMGSIGGYFYQTVTIRAQNTGEELNLLVRPVDTHGLYVFPDGFNFQLISENPKDGSFENNMSDTLSIRIHRGGGKCFLSSHSEKRGL